MTRTLFLLSFLLASAASSQQVPQQLQGQELVKALRQGGYVIVMRHASSPREVPDKATANPDNVKPERQLDKEGRDSATAMGKALRDLKIPIGAVLTSPTYRALETIRYAQFGNPQAFPELGDNGQSMQGGTEAQASWLRKKVTELPKGANTLIVTHMPNMSRAFPQSTERLEDGEALVFGPSGVLARIKIEEWKGMAK
ncbi:MAG: histidine phosphatase family protein [Acidobacteriia bacterium]|nr:histidine phosphatase family protein [Terriglobia bacterium]